MDNHRSSRSAASSFLLKSTRGRRVKESGTSGLWLHDRFAEAVRSITGMIDDVSLWNRSGLVASPVRSMTVEGLEQRQLLAGVPMITEFMAKNDSVLRDGDGRRPDWIEIQNVGDAALDLAGLSAHRHTQANFRDGSFQASVWIRASIWLYLHPDRILPATWTLVATCTRTSGSRQAVNTWPSWHRTEPSYRSTVAPMTSIRSKISNVSYGVAQEEALIDGQSDATYWLPLSDAVDGNWTGIEFDALANGFSEGKAAMGYEGDPDARWSFTDEFTTELPADAHGIYARMEFDLDDAEAVNRLKLSLKNDNGFIAYLNGVQVAESNVSGSGWFAVAGANTPSDSQALRFADFDVSEHVTALVDGTNVLAIHLLNHIPDAGRSFCSYLKLVASVTSENAKTGYMTEPSPGAENVGGTTVFEGTVADTVIDAAPGFYDEPVTVSISTETADAEIRYTTNGAPPTATTGTVYTEPLQVETTTVPTRPPPSRRITFPRRWPRIRTCSWRMLFDSRMTSPAFPRAGTSNPQRNDIRPTMKWTKRSSMIRPSVTRLSTD